MASDGVGSLGFISLILMSSAVLTIVSARRKRSHLWKIIATPRSKTETAPQGHVELGGFAWPQSETTLTSLAGDECVYYSLILERLETKGSGKDKRKEWVYVDSVSLSEPFYLIDSTGIAEIDPAGASLEFSSQRTNRWYTLKAAEKERAANYFSGRGIKGFPARGVWGFFFGPRYRLRESILVSGCPLHALGDFKTANDGHAAISSPGLTSFTRKVFQKGARELKNVNRLLDRNGDGKVTELEARQGYQFAAKSSRDQARIAQEQEQTFEVHGRLAKSEHHPLQISDSHEHHLVERMQKTSRRLALSGYSMLITSALMIFFLFKEDRRPVNRHSSSTISTQQVPEFHNRCLKNEVHACHMLLANSQALQLTPEYVDLYLNHARSNGR